MFLWRKTLLSLNSSFVFQLRFSRRIQPKVVRIFSEKDKKYPQNTPISNAEFSRTMKHFDEGFQFKKQTDDENILTEKIKSQECIKLPKYEKINYKNNEFSETIIKIMLKKSDLIILEGKRLINDAIMNNINIKYIFFSDKDILLDIIELNSLVEEQQIKLIKVPYKEMKIYSSLVTNPGLIAISEKPNFNKLVEQNEKFNDFPLILICDNIRDPGNMGAILRTSAAAGINKIILTEGCVDVWNNKVLKSACGAHFKIPIESKINWQHLSEKLPKNFDLYMADSKINAEQSSLESILYYNVDFFQKNNCKVLVIGNEAFGLSDNLYEFAKNYSSYRLRIPLYSASESLNSAIASAILIYEIRKQFNLFKNYN